MKLYSGNENYKLYHGNMLDLLDVIGPESVDSIVTDPPYELNFMNKGWDNSGVAFQKETWSKCFTVLKRGGYLLAFGGSRTYHRIACAIEDAGFEIRDTIMWLYGSGMPKSMNIGKAVESKLVNGSANPADFKNLEGEKAASGNWGLNKANMEQGARPTDYSADKHLRTVKVDYQTEEGKKWDGWGTCLKPAYEPIIVARKPCEGTTTDNILKYGVGGFNIDECRIGNEERSYKGMSSHKPENAGCFRDDNWQPKDIEVTVNGRFPANVILTYDDTDFEEVCNGFPGEENCAARYFYCAKASRRDRDEGLGKKHSTHPTVKPTELMQYLIRLVTPNNGIVLDPFNGSGSTGKAVMWENKERMKGYRYIGIELTEEYLPISKARIEYVSGAETNLEETFEIQSAASSKQMNIFDLL